jgi:hypothetical protein
MNTKMTLNGSAIALPLAVCAPGTQNLAAANQQLHQLQRRRAKFSLYHLSQVEGRKNEHISSVVAFLVAAGGHPLNHHNCCSIRKSGGRGAYILRRRSALRKFVISCLQEQHYRRAEYLCYCEDDRGTSINLSRAPMSSLGMYSPLSDYMNCEAQCTCGCTCHSTV